MGKRKFDKGSIPKVEAYNPLDKKHIGESVAKMLLETPASPLPPEPFLGAGIYAIYYTGANPLYKEIAMHSDIWPIYVGKAVPKGSRKGGYGFDAETEPVLYGRLKEHADSISQAEGLDLKDFSCRYLVVDDIWIPLAESILIEKFSPVWNKLIDGFGNHDPGGGRYSQKKSAWDVLHPGRSWVKKLKSASFTAEELGKKVAEYISKNKPHS